MDYPNQSKLLQADIITFEVVEVNGMQALAPKIYLSQNSIDKLLGTNTANNNAKNNNNANSSSLATNSTIYAKENLTINAPNASLVNNGSIKAGNNQHRISKQSLRNCFRYRLQYQHNWQ